MQDVFCTGAPDETLRLTFSLDSGRRVWLTEFFFTATYDSLLSGRPDEDMNRSIVEQAAVKARELFRETPYVIEPDLRPDASGTKWLPPIWCIADLMSTPVDPLRHMSALVVVWFGQPFFDRPLRAVIPEALAAVPWEQHCRDFEF
jgi:hypothetical protein